MKRSLLYIVNFYGTPPLNYLEKYLKTDAKVNLTILKLPAVRSIKNRLVVDAFIKEENDAVHSGKLDIFFPIPYFFVFFIQYFVNFFLLFYLLGKVKRKKFDIVIGETNFGSAVAYLLKKIGRAKFSVFFCGDILPDPDSSKNCFFLVNSNNPPKKFIKFIDSLLIRAQIILRKIGYRNDLIWYGNRKIEQWDKDRKLLCQQKIIYDPILIDYHEYLKYKTGIKNMNYIGYIGRLDDYVGLEIIIPALAQIKKTIPGIKFHVIGGNEISIKKYKRLAHDFAVFENVIFYGYIPEMKNAYDILSSCALGIALYKPTMDNVSMIAQPAKPKEYIKVGTPVLVTVNGPAIGSEIVRTGAGIGSRYDIGAVTEKIITVLTDRRLFGNLQTGVDKFAQAHHFGKTLSRVWKEVEKTYRKYR